MRNLALSLSGLFVACAMTACGGNLQNEGVTPDTLGKRIDATCVDYAGNEVVNVKGMRGSLTESDGNITLKPDGKPGTTVRNGGGCIITEWEIDPTLPANKAALQAAHKNAPLYVVVTNSSDTILMADKFSEASSEPTKAELGLKTAGNNTLYKITVTGGLNLISTPNKESLSPLLADAFPTLDNNK